jgi:hypothetical protein
MTTAKTNRRALTDCAGDLTDKQLDAVSGGSQSSGAGAGKVSFNPFSITRKIDRASPIFFQN